MEEIKKYFTAEFQVEEEKKEEEVKSEDEIEHVG